MKSSLLLALLDATPKVTLPTALSSKVVDRTLTYDRRDRGTWQRPDYSEVFTEIAAASNTEGYLLRAIKKKTDRILIAGWEFVGRNADTVSYIKNRVQTMSWATQKPFDELIEQLFADLFRQNNHIWVKKRDLNGSPREQFGKTLYPVAGYFTAAFNTFETKRKKNGEIQKWKQVSRPNGETKEFSPDDIIHFCSNRQAGFWVGTPELFPALDDIALLRRIEENVEDLIETTLFPTFHYKIGNEKQPEARGPDGRTESAVIRDTIEYMPPGGFYVSDYRHEITAIGGEGKALKIEGYLEYFKRRALSSIGTSALDMGEGADATRSTASTLSKGMLLDVEAVAVIVKRQIEFYVITELMLEGGYNPFDPDEAVEIRFGVIDREERRAGENMVLQKWENQAITVDEMRRQLSESPWTDDMHERTYYSMYQEPLALISGTGPGTAASEALSKLPGSNITPEGVSKEKQFAVQQQKEANRVKLQQKKASAAGKNKARPANQHGKRSSAKTTHDFQSMTMTDFDFDMSENEFTVWQKKVLDRYNSVAEYGVDLETVIFNLTPRMK